MREKRYIHACCSLDNRVLPPQLCDQETKYLTQYIQVAGSIDYLSLSREILFVEHTFPWILQQLVKSLLLDFSTFRNIGIVDRKWVAYAQNSDAAHSFAQEHSWHA